MDIMDGLIQSLMYTPDFGCESQRAILQRSVQKMLKSRIFLGRYVERRLVNEHVGYCDVILLSPAEEELQRDLFEVRELLKREFQTYWIGISDVEAFPEYKSGISIWTEIDDKPFGAFWLQIKTVQYRSNEILITLKFIRHITERFIELEPFLTKAVRTTQDDSLSTTTESLSDTCNEILCQIKSNLSFKSIKDGIFFIIALMIALITGALSMVNFLGTFILSLVREMSFLIKNSTPLLLGCLDFLSKIVGGFYILLAMLFKQTTPRLDLSRDVSSHHRGRKYLKNEKIEDYDDGEYD